MHDEDSMLHYSLGRHDLYGEARVPRYTKNPPKASKKEKIASFS